MAIAMTVVALWACAPSEQQADTLGRYLLESLSFARQTADTSMLEEIFLPDATYDDFPSQIEYRGIQDIVGHLTSVHDWADDVYMSLGGIRTGPSTAVGEWFFAGVQARPIPELVGVGTGREVAFNGITLIEIEDGRIARAADYWDQAALLLALGAEIHLPDSTVMRGDEAGN
jgi:hypothetical protein